MIEQSEEQRKTRKWQKINKLFLIVDITASTVMLLLSFVFIPNQCSMSFFLFWTIYFIGQAIQHYLILKMPKIDVVFHDKLIKRYVTVVSVIEAIYFCLMFMFWVKTQLHPFYCFICLQLGIPAIIGLFFVAHFILSLFLYIQFLYGYINRKYYLMALGGFEVERRMNLQREQNLRRASLIEPYYNEYPVINEETINKEGKFYKFEDIKQDVEGEEVCSICLTRDKAGFHPIFTSCRHFFHRQCIQNWAKISGKCPQCRTALQEQQMQEEVNEEQNN